MASTPIQIDIGDANMAELCSDKEHSNAEVEENYHDQLEKKLLGKFFQEGSPAISCVKHSVAINFLEKRRKKT